MIGRWEIMYKKLGADLSRANCDAWIINYSVKVVTEAVYCVTLSS